MVGQGFHAFTLTPANHVLFVSLSTPLSPIPPSLPPPLQVLIIDLARTRGGPAPLYRVLVGHPPNAALATNFPGPFSKAFLRRTCATTQRTPRVEHTSLFRFLQTDLFYSSLHFESKTLTNLRRLICEAERVG